MTFTQLFPASPLPRIKEIASDTPSPDAVTLTRYLGVIDGEIRTLCLYDREVEGYIGDSGQYTPPLDMYASSDQDRDKGRRDPCKCEMYGHCLCSLVAGAIKGSCLIRPCEHGCMDGCPCQTCAGRKFVQLSEQGEIWTFVEDVIAWEDDDGNVRIRRTTKGDPVKLKISLPFPNVDYRSMRADAYHCDRCGANIAPFSRFDELNYIGADTHGVPLFHDCSNCGLESGGAIGGMESFTDDANRPPLSTWDGVRTNRPRVEKGEARVFPNMRASASLPSYPRIGQSVPPIVFISYSWGDETHEVWVHELAMRLESDEVDVIFDKTGLKPGDSISKFIEESLEASDFVLVICTPEYKNRYDTNEGGGVAYEGRFIADAILRGVLKRDRVIPVLRNGAGPDSIPGFIAGNVGVNLSDSHRYSEHQYAELLQVLHRDCQT